jgi:hypothetical protein
VNAVIEEDKQRERQYILAEWKELNKISSKYNTSVINLELS